MEEYVTVPYAHIKRFFGTHASWTTKFDIEMFL